MELVLSNKNNEDERPVSYVSFLHATNGNKERAQEKADAYNLKHGLVKENE